MNIEIIYTDKLMTKIEINEISNWTELRSSKTVKIREGEYAEIPLGIKVIIPSGYEMHIIPKSSLFKKNGLLQTSGIQVITKDNVNELTIPVFATKDTTINFNDRICQFKIEKIEKFNFIIN